MAQLLNSRSNSPVRIGRKVKKIVSLIQSLINKFPTCCWYDGKWCWSTGITHVYETCCLSISCDPEGVRFLFEDPYGMTCQKLYPYNGRLYSKLRALQQLIWISPDYHTTKDAPKWALKYGRNYRQGERRRRR